MYQVVKGVKVWGTPDPEAVDQMVRCRSVGSVADTALMADHHKGYSQPIGGVVAYLDHVSPSGVGYDIACGNKAVRTDLKLKDVRPRLHRILDRIQSEISFGIGRKNPDPVDHELFESETWRDVPELLSLKKLAYQQLGTVGAGNHFVDILVEPETEDIWVAVHFGSRGFGHKTATGFLNLAKNRPFDAKGPGENMDQPPTIIPARSPLGEAYIAAMKLAGRYAYAGRDIVTSQVLRILEARSTF
jgi:tRNA-splicing ligase RtcB